MRGGIRCYSAQTLFTTESESERADEKERLKREAKRENHKLSEPSK